MISPPINRKTYLALLMSSTNDRFENTSQQLDIMFCHFLGVSEEKSDVSGGLFFAIFSLVSQLEKGEDDFLQKICHKRTPREKISSDFLRLVFWSDSSSSGVR